MLTKAERIGGFQSGSGSPSPMRLATVVPSNPMHHETWMEADLLMSVSYHENINLKVQTLHFKPAALCHSQEMSTHTIPGLPPRSAPTAFVQQNQPMFFSSPSSELPVNMGAHQPEGVMYSGINHRPAAPVGGYFYWAHFDLSHMHVCHGSERLSQGNEKRKSERPRWRGRERWRLVVEQEQVALALKPAPLPATQSSCKFLLKLKNSSRQSW